MNYSRGLLSNRLLSNTVDWKLIFLQETQSRNITFIVLYYIAFSLTASHTWAFVWVRIFFRIRGSNLITFRFWYWFITYCCLSPLLDAIACVCYAFVFVLRSNECGGARVRMTESPAWEHTAVTPLGSSGPWGSQVESEWCQFRRQALTTALSGSSSDRPISANAKPSPRRNCKAKPRRKRLTFLKVRLEALHLPCVTPVGSVKRISLGSSLNTKCQETFAFNIRPVVFSNSCVSSPASNSFDYATWTCFFFHYLIFFPYLAMDVRLWARGLSSAKRPLRFWKQGKQDPVTHKEKLKKQKTTFWPLAVFAEGASKPLFFQKPTTCRINIWFASVWLFLNIGENDFYFGPRCCFTAQASRVVLFALWSTGWMLVCPWSLGCLFQFIDSQIAADWVRCVAAGIWFECCLEFLSFDSHLMLLICAASTHQMVHFLSRFIRLMPLLRHPGVSHQDGRRWRKGIYCSPKPFHTQQWPFLCTRVSASSRWWGLDTEDRPSLSPLLYRKSNLKGVVVIYWLLIRLVQPCL